MEQIEYNKWLKSECESPALIEVSFKLNLLLKLNPSILCVQQHHKKAISVEKWRTGARERVEVMWNSGSKKWREAAKLLQLVSKVIGHFKKLWNIKFGWTNIG